MTGEFWLAAAFGMVVALALGFVLGRRSAPTRQAVVTAQKERDEARAEVERVRGEVTRHFEESAQMFGQLADNYRTFFEHFSATARNLGLSEGRARELLRRADPRLVADQSGTESADGEAQGAGGEAQGPAGDFTAEEAEALGLEAGRAATAAGGEPAAGGPAPADGDGDAADEAADRGDDRSRQA